MVSSILVFCGFCVNNYVNFKSFRTFYDCFYYGFVIYFILFFFVVLFSERELTFTFAICYRPSVCLSSVTFVVKSSSRSLSHLLMSSCISF